MEKWIEFKKYYEVSNLGRVKSLPRKMIMKNGRIKNVKERIKAHYIMNNGYHSVSLSENGTSKSYLIHRLVAEAFIPNPLNLPEVNHKDGNKNDNNVSNLEWCTHSYNQKHASINNLMAIGETHGRHKLTLIEVNEIRNLKDKMLLKEIAKKYSVSIGMISLILNNKNWKI